MAVPTQKLRSNGLPDVQRHITDHDTEGKAVLSTSIPSEGEWQKIGSIADFFVGYTTRKFPVSLSPAEEASPNVSPLPQDIESYKKDMVSPPGLSISTGIILPIGSWHLAIANKSTVGTVVRYVDMAPNVISPMHRTVSLDYGFVLEGEIELVLDSGETRLMKRGDMCVQRATNHAWRNVTPNNGWGRMVYVLVGAEKIEIAGKKLEEDLGDMEVVRASD